MVVSINTRSLWTAGGLLKEATAMTTTAKRAMATVATATGTKWNFLERGRSEGGVQTDGADQTVGGTGLSTTEAGLHRGTGAENAAGRGIVTERVGDRSHLTGTERGHEAGPQVVTGNVVDGKTRGSGGQRVRQASAESGATRPSEAETPRRPARTGTENGTETERGRRRKRRVMMRKRRKNC